MRILITAIAALLIALSAQARLGETAQEIQVRYGSPLASAVVIGLTNQVYEHQSFRITVWFDENRCVQEEIEPIGTNTLNGIKCRALIEAIAGPGDWKADSSLDISSKSWIRKDGVEALFLDQKLIIESKEFRQQREKFLKDEAARRKKEGVKPAAGF